MLNLMLKNNCKIGHLTIITFYTFSVLTHFELCAVILRNTFPLNITVSVARSKYDGHARMWR